MFRILSSKRYWSLIGKIADDQETIKGQAKVISAQQERIKELSAEIQKKQETNDYLNELIFKKNRELHYKKKEAEALRSSLAAHVSFLDFPATEKLPDPKTDINQILEQ